MTLELYRALTRAAAPLVRLWLAHRTRRGKEDPARRGERWGRGGRARPEGPLVWLHAASVGESLAALPLIERLLKRSSALHLLVTSGTVTSARLLAERLPERAFHQYAPVDLPQAVDRFLDHWRPALALVLESELWPNLLSALKARRIPSALINARMSERSFARWRRLQRTAQTLLEGFDLILAQSETDARRLRALGAARLTVCGNIKHDAPALGCERATLEALEARLAGRPRWLAASTHPGEEAMAARVHRRLKARHPGLLTVIVPRHPERGPALERELRSLGLTLARRTRQGEPEAQTDILLGDTLGEMGLYYRLCPIVFVGGSLVPHGGQNPLEPARLGAAILFGPHMENFAPERAALEGRGGAIGVADEDALAVAVDELLRDAARARAQGRRGSETAQGLTGALQRSLDALEALLKKTVGPGTRC